MKKNLKALKKLFPEKYQPKSAKNTAVPASIIPAQPKAATPTTIPAPAAKGPASNQHHPLSKSNRPQPQMTFPTKAETSSSPKIAVSPIVLTIAKAAGEEGMYAFDLIRFPELLAKHGIDVAKAHPALATQADQHNRQETDKVLAFWKARNERITSYRSEVVVS